jgi:hypothetical protein
VSIEPEHGRVLMNERVLDRYAAPYENSVLAARSYVCSKIREITVFASAATALEIATEIAAQSEIENMTRVNR